MPLYCEQTLSFRSHPMLSPLSINNEKEKKKKKKKKKKCLQKMWKTFFSKKNFYPQNNIDSRL